MEWAIGYVVVACLSAGLIGYAFDVHWGEFEALLAVIGVVVWPVGIVVVAVVQSYRLGEKIKERKRKAAYQARLREQEADRLLKAEGVLPYRNN